MSFRPVLTFCSQYYSLKAITDHAEVIEKLYHISSTPRLNYIMAVNIITDQWQVNEKLYHIPSAYHHQSGRAHNPSSDGH